MVRRSEAGNKMRAATKQSTPRSFRILVVDDAEGIRTYLANLLELAGYDVDTAEDGRSALALIEGGSAPDVIILDVMMPGIDGIEVLRRIRKLEEEVPVIMLSVVGKASTIVDAMKLGAVDYLNKPFDEAELLLTLENALEKKALERERELLSEGLEGLQEGAIWINPAMLEIKRVLEQVADTDVTVLVYGESGVGKEIVARTVHGISSRSGRAFVKLNCAALPEDLLESELFGYEKGAFTGASGRKPGKFETANKGTMFLDEIGEMSPPLQAKLLQVLQDGEFTRLGGNEEVAVDVRVICATHRNLEEMVQEGAFREDLFFRLNVVNVTVPPLRERRDEIPALIDIFLRRYAPIYKKPLLRISDELMRAFERYSFPGNVRELENMIKRVLVLENEQSVMGDLLQSERSKPSRMNALNELIEHAEQTAGEIPLREVGRLASREAEREIIGKMLNRTHWNRKQAARLLGISYKTLLQKIRGCGLSPG